MADKHPDDQKESWDMGPLLVRTTMALLCATVGFVFWLAGYQTIYRDGPSSEIWGAVTGIIGFVTGVVMTVVTFRFGTSRSSMAKDGVIRRLVER